MTSAWKHSCCVSSPHNSQLTAIKTSFLLSPSSSTTPPLLCASNSVTLQNRKSAGLAMPSSIRLLRMFNQQENKEKKETTSPLDELHESDVVWSSYSQSPPPTPLFTPHSPTQFDGIGDTGSPLSRSPVLQRKKTAVTTPMVSAAVTSPLSRSAPLKVPIWPLSRGVKSMGRFDEEDEEGFDDDDEEEMVPPHEMVARSHRTTSFSVVEGAGRTLKGRDLSTVRNAIMQRTGFLD